MKRYHDSVKRFRFCCQKYLKTSIYCDGKCIYIMMSRALYFDGALNVRYGPHICYCALIKKENEIFLIYKEIKNGAVAKSYMTNGNGLLIYGEIFANFLTN
jgi:hypothetical protein